MVKLSLDNTDNGGNTVKKAIILSASTGGGHNRAANAIKEELMNTGFQSVEVIDSLKSVSNTVDKLISKGYETSALYTPKAYGEIYKISDFKPLKKELKRNILFKYMLKKLKVLIREKNPDLIIGTHPFPLMAVSSLKNKGIISTPVFSVLTDYTIHSTWVQDQINAYIVGDEYVKALLEEEGVKKENIFPFGIPIEKSFLSSSDPERVKEELMLEDKFTILLMGGSFGAGGVRGVLEELLQINEDIQIIAVAGRNNSLRQKLEKTVEDYKAHEKVRVLGFTKDMSSLLSLATVIVTKPGGLTTTEAILKETPMIVPYYIPGQEEENLEFLLNNGLALRPTKRYPLGILIKILIDYPERLLSIKESMHRVKKEASAVNIASLAIKYTNHL